MSLSTCWQQHFECVGMRPDAPPAAEVEPSASGAVVEAPAVSEGGGASSSGLAPPPMPGNMYGVATVYFGSGRISAYKGGRFEAVCNDKRHTAMGQRCVLTRYVPDTASKKVRFETMVAKGRPLGLMAV